MPSIAGPKRPQDRINLKDKDSFQKELSIIDPKNKESEITLEDDKFSIKNGDIVIAAITSCTNTSNPSVMIAAGLKLRKLEN